MTRLTRALLRLLPRRFRDRFGDDLADLIVTASDEEGRRAGRWAEMRRSGRELVSLVRLSVDLRRERPDRTRAGLALGPDLRAAVRHVRRRPTASLAVVVTLAAALSAVLVTTVTAQSVLWRPLPFADPDRLFFAWERVTRDGTESPARVTFGRYRAWVDGGGPFDGLAAFGGWGLRLDSATGARAVWGLRVSPGYFDVLGVTPLLGRAFAPADADPGAPLSIILSHSLWTELGAQPDIVNTRLRAGNDQYTVIGVMRPVASPGFPVNPADVSIEPGQREFWVPIARSPELEANTRAHVFGVIARIARGRTAVEAELALQRTAQGSVEPHGAKLTPFRNQFVSDAGPQLAVLLSAALAIFLIAGANLAALLASAFELRRGEFAVRAALGAGSGRLVRQLCVEAFVLSAVAGALALIVTRVFASWLPSALPAGAPLLTAPAVDAVTVLTAIVFVTVAALVISLWPAWRLRQTSSAARNLAARTRLPVHRVLVVVQVAATLALVVTASLLGRSLDHVRGRDAGFAVDRTLVASLSMGLSQPVAADLVVATGRDLQASIEGVPGVRSVAMAYDHPLAANWSDGYVMRGDAASSASPPRVAELRIVSPSYFTTVRTEVVTGRAFSDDDGWGRPGVALVNEAFAREAGGPVVGRRLATGSPARNWPGAPAEFEIIGVVEDERFRGLEQPSRPALYLSIWQFPQATVQLLVRTEGEPLASASAIRQAVRRPAPAASLDRVTSLNRILAGQLAARRITTGVVTTFGSIALALSAVGLYGLLAVGVADRRRELGVRLALGATPASLARAVFSDGLRWTAIGVASGLVLSFLAGRLVASQLVDVPPWDPVTIALSAAVLLLVAAVAIVVPARRAAVVDPWIELRSE